MQHIKVARLTLQHCLKSGMGSGELLRLQQGKCIGKLLLRGPRSVSHLCGRAET
jgi:hypothetical protein